MTRLDALRIHAFHAAAAALTGYFTLAAGGLALALGAGSADALALGAAALAFFAVIASVATDLASRRIPNSLSLMLLLAAPLWWAAAGLGSGIADAPGAGPGAGALDGLLADLLPQAAGGAFLPAIGWAFPASIAADLLMMLVVFVPLFLSFRFGLGFGGGDVKLITAGSLFLGWPLGFDFLVASYLAGGVFSAVAILGRICCRGALRFGVESPPIRRVAAMREFPYAPAIAIAAILCLAAKLEGLS